jgi:predicted ATPase/DNA-binding SARP family transcriptional activator
MDFQILGPLEVRDGSRPVAVPGPRVRALLARLAISAGTVVTQERLIDDLWGQPDAAKALQVTVGRLRRALGCPPDGGVLLTRPSGYLLDLRAEHVLDAAAFEAEFAEGRRELAADRPRVAVDRLDRALGRWRGLPLQEFVSAPWAQAEGHRLEQLRLDALETRAEAQLRLGAAAEVSGELQLLAQQVPGRERIHELLMLALYRSGRQLDALAAFQTARTHLIEEFGVEPGEQMRAVHAAILQQDPTLRDPPLAAAERAPRRLPRFLSSFVGRAAEIADVTRLLESERLLTLTGVGGIGKTRLAVEAAAEGADREVYFAGLAAVADAGLLGRTVLDALGQPEQPGRTALDVAADVLAAVPALVVLDNCEHLLDPAAVAVRELLERCPRLRVLATSRTALDVPGEYVWPVPPLSVAAPSGTAWSGTGESAANSDAVRLFAARARRVSPQFVLTAESARTVADICAAMDGLPLAIELAAARLRVLTLGQLAAGQADRLTLAGGGPRGGEPRQRTLRASIAWSEALLGPAERALLHRLAVFSGGATLEQVRAVCGDALVSAARVLDLLTALIDASLLSAVPVAGVMRYQLLETIRQYGLQQLDRDGLLAELQGRHLRSFTREADRYDDGRLVLTADVVASIDADYPNLLAAFETACGLGDVAAMRICLPLANYWVERGRQSEGADLLKRALAVARDELADPESMALKSLTLSGLALMRIHEGDLPAAARLGEQAAEMGAQAGDARAEALGLMRLGLCAGFGEPRRGAPLIRRAVALLIVADHPVTLAFARYCLVEILAQGGDWAVLRPALEACWSTAADLGHRTVLSWCLVHEGNRAELDGDLARLRGCGERVIRGQDDPLLNAAGTAAIAQAHVLAGEPGAARELLQAAIEPLVDRPGLALSVLMSALAGAELAEGDLDAARRACPDPREPNAVWFTTSVAHTRLRCALAEGDTETARAMAGLLRDLRAQLGNARAGALGDLGHARADLLDGDLDGARERQQASLAAFLREGCVLHVMDAVELGAAVAAEAGADHLAARLLAAVAAERERAGVVRVPPERGYWAGGGARLRDRLGPGAYADACRSGASLPFSVATALAREV